MRSLPSPLRRLIHQPPSPMAIWSDGVNKPRIFVAPTCTSLAVEGKEGYGKGCILSLRHPKSGEKTGYLFRDGSLQELQWFKQCYGSWFLGDYISEDGGLYISTPIDPVFLLLPLFLEARMQKENNQGMFRELSEIFYVDGFPGYQHLLPLAENSMKLLCELKEIGSSKFFRLDDSKVLAWMCYKVSRLQEALPKLDQNYAARAERDTLIDIVSILGEYLVDDPWLNLLGKHFKLDLQEAVREHRSDEILKAVESHQTHSAPPLAKKLQRTKHFELRETAKETENPSRIEKHKGYVEEDDKKRWNLNSRCCVGLGLWMII